MSVPSAEVGTNDAATQDESASQKIWLGFVGFGKTLLSAMEYVGEGVADLLGLDDSKFQDVIDTMTEEEWEEAREVDRERRLQDAILEEQEARDKMESGSEGIIGTGQSGETSDELKKRVTNEFMMKEMLPSTEPPITSTIHSSERDFSAAVVSPEQVTVDTPCDNVV